MKQDILHRFTVCIHKLLELGDEARQGGREGEREDGCIGQGVNLGRKHSERICDLVSV